MGAFYQVLFFVIGLHCHRLISSAWPPCADLVRTSPPKNQNVTNFQLIFDHPLLDVSQGFIPGTPYTVRLTSVNDGLSFDGYVIQSQVNGKGFGKFVDPPSGVQLCGSNLNAGLQKIDAHSLMTATFTWLVETTVRSTCVQLTASVRSQGAWTRTVKEICKRKDNCFKIQSDHYGILTQDDINSTLTQHCPLIDVVFQRPKHEKIFLQIRNLTTANDDYPVCKDAFVAVSVNMSSSPQRFCGSHRSLTSYSGEHMALQVKYLPNNSSFTAVYYTLDKRKGCNDTITSFQGHITSPNFPRPYYPNLDCYIYVSVSPGQQVVFQLRTLRLQPQGDDGVCNLEFLQMSNKDDSQSLLKVCGRIRSPLPEVTVTTDTIVHFHSDGLIEDEGFLISYRRVQGDCDERHILSHSRGFVLSSSNLHNCTVTIHVPYGYAIEIGVSFKSENKSGVNVTELLVKPTSTESNCSLSLLEMKDKDGNVWIKCVQDGFYRTTTNTIQIRLVSLVATDIEVTYNAFSVNHSLTECDYGWISGNDYCYLLEREAVSWEDAEDACKAQGGHLASVGDIEAQILLEEIIYHSLLNSNDTSVWIGGNDRAYENCFEWADNRPFSFTYWFPGWVHSNFYNSQPSDDGLANQDCVEMRRDFRYAAKGFGLADHFYWNDRDCRVANPYICEKLRPGVTFDPYPPDCNRSIILSLENHRAILSSPGYPEPYPRNMECYTVIHAPHNYKIILTFISFILEEDAQCHYDYLEISEPSGSGQRYCGDWNSRLKLLRYISIGNVLQLVFKSDYSHSFAGFRAEVALDQGNDLCDDPRLYPYGNKCYLFVSYPEVTWYTARKICREMQGQLTSITSQSVQNFINERIQKMETYTSGTLFWLGGFRKSNHHAWQWVDGSPFNYTDWYPGWMKERNEPMSGLKHHNEFTQESCLASQWKSVKDSSGRLKYSGLYWESQACEQSGGYICKKDQAVVEANVNSTVYGHRGNLTSPNYPATYPNKLDYTIRIIGPIGTRILLQFNHLDLEWQEDCLYDYISLRSSPEKPQTRICGQHSTGLEKFDFTSDRNELLATIRTDYSIVGMGFEAFWTTVDVKSCPTRYKNVPSGKIQSVNYPSNYISNLNCVIEIFTHPGSRVWLEFLNFDVGTMNSDGVCTNDFMELSLGHKSLQKMALCGDKNKAIEALKFLSFGDYVKIIFHSDAAVTKTGYLASFKTVQKLEESRYIYVHANETGTIPPLNLLLSTPSNVNFTNKLVAPLGYVIHLQLSQVLFNPNSDFNASCPGGIIQVEDSFRLSSKPKNLCAMQNDALGEQVTFTSIFNTLYIRQITLEMEMIGFDVFYSTRLDPDFLNKTLEITSIETIHGFCDPNPCLHGGICNTSNNVSRCVCKGYYTGLFCHLTKCDFNPCIQGTCNLTQDDFKCVCNTSYGGRLCDKYLGVCASRPCGDGGKCSDVNNTVVCTCYVWWEGPRCEHKVFKIPYKPLSRRMLEEPFWLGLITVSIVLLVLGCIWCIKRKFADKFERFLAEEIERSKQNQQRGRSSSVSKLNKLTSSEQIAASPQPAARSLLSRLGRSRKHSMLNLDPNSKSRRYQENRSFSFDDLLRKGSPRRRSHAILSGASTSGGPEEATKDILQSLVSPVPKLHRRMSLEEFIQLSEQKLKAVQNLTHSAQTLHNSSTEETSFSNLIVPKRHHTKVLKKKVSFAKCVESAAEALATQNSENETCGSTSSISQTIISDTEDITSGDDVPLDVPNLSSSSSSSESPSRRTRYQDDPPTYPVVIVHQPPPDSPPKLVDSLHTKSSINDDYDSAPEEIKIEVEEVSSSGKNLNMPSKDDAQNSTAVFRCLQTCIADNNPKMHLQLEDALANPKTTNVSLEKDVRLGAKDDTDKVHAIDDLAEALEKKKLDEVTNATRLQIPIYALHDIANPLRKSSLDGSLLRIPEKFPRRLSVDTALVPAVSNKAPFGFPFHRPLATSPTNPRNAKQQMFVSKRLKSKPPPLQIPKLIQAETAYMPTIARSDKSTIPDNISTPIITITSNLSSCDSDVDSPNKLNAGAQYLSPYVYMGPTDDYMCTSLSNLSSSGYSSMNSPVASRCNSNNPLFPASENEMELPLTPRQAGGFKPYTKAGFLCPPIATFHQSRNPYYMVDRTPSTSSREVSPPSGMSSPSRKRSSSEMTDDLVDELAEDEGIGLDQNADKVSDVVSDASDLPVKDPGPGQGNFIPPMIVVQPDQSDLYWQNLRRPSFERTLSPVSSRSESPVSERGDHFSPQFYNTDSLAPPIFTDSDCPSSEVPATVLKPPSSKRQGRRRERPQVSRQKPVTDSTTQRLDPAKDRKTIKRASPKRRNKTSVHASEQCSSSSDSSSPTAQKCLLPSTSSISNRGYRKRFPFGHGLKKKENLHQNKDLNTEESSIDPVATDFDVVDNGKKNQSSSEEELKQLTSKHRKPIVKDVIPLEQKSHLLNDDMQTSSGSMTTTSEED